MLCSGVGRFLNVVVCMCCVIGWLLIWCSLRY